MAITREALDRWGLHVEEIICGKRASPIFMSPVGLVGLCGPDFLGDLAAAGAPPARAARPASHIVALRKV